MILALAGGDITKYDEIKNGFDVSDYLIQQWYRKYESYCEQIFIKRKKQQ
jgi:hypothetical protein